MVQVKIHLSNNERAIYHAGEMITGTIEMFLSRPKKFRGLCFVVYGAAKCHWTETHSTTSGSGRSRTTRTNTVHYKGKDVYLNTRTYLFGRDGGDSIEIASGTYKYDFAVQLPPQLPFSFEGAHGSIRYYVEACLDIPWDFDEEIKKPFTVVRIDDLNLNRELRIPVRCEEVKTFCCLFCESDPLVMNATIPCTGFIPGQNVLIKVDYVNKSDVFIDHTRFSLKRIIHFNSTSPRSKTKTNSDKMAEVFGPGVRPGATISFDKVINVPQIAVNSNNLLCNVVQIYYQLTIEASAPFFHGNIEFNIPITIGTIPIDLAPAATAPPPAISQTTIIATAPPTFDSFPNAPSPKAPLLAPEDIPPPSFDEAIKTITTTSSSNNEPRIGWIKPNSDYPSENICRDTKTFDN